MIKIKKETIKPKFIEDFICNKSDVIFNESELALLNKGLNFTPKPNTPQLMDAVMDIETIIKYKTYSVQEDVRRSTKQIIEQVNNYPTYMRQNNNFDVIKSLKSKDCVYVKADKGNK